MSTRTRRFTIADGMILVAATAVGLLCLRSFLPGYQRWLVAQRQFGFIRSWADEVVCWLCWPPACLVVPVMAALVVARLMPPRPRFRRLARQPGFVACTAALISLLAGLASTLAMSHRPGFQQLDAFFTTWNEVAHWTPQAVTGAWAALILCRRWRSEPSWIDRLGRFLGAYFFLIFIISAYLQYHWIPFLQTMFP